ncbi:TPA: hypothetical protein DCR79_01305 [Patescibacteria group bacterium]|nr:hypothetical protein [Patescibacteria group bacterium]
MSATILWEENIMTTKDLLNDLAKGLIPRQSKHYRGSVYSPRKQGIAKIAETISAICGNDFIKEDDTIIVPTDKVTEVLARLIDICHLNVVAVDAQVAELRLVA